MYASSDRERGESPDLHEERCRFWWQPPDRLREAVESEAARGQTRTTVLDGAVWWMYTPEWGAVSNVELDDDERAQHTAGGGERFRPLLDPSGFIALLDFGEPEDAGDRLRVRARPRDDVEGQGFHLHLHLVGGADEYELELDRDTGIVRRLVSFLDGHELAATELTELVLDEELPGGTFAFVPPPGVEVLPPEPHRHRQYTLEEAAGAAPFPVLYVPELPDGDWRLHVHFSEPRTRPPVPASVSLVYHRADGRGALIVAERAVGEGGFGWAGREPPELETVERDGITFTFAHGDPERGGQNAVRFERGGTAVQLQSQELDVETLLGLAASLRGVPAA
jgi:outer membrane lipoprotein-sorting protein